MILFTRLNNALALKLFLMVSLVSVTFLLLVFKYKLNIAETQYRVPGDINWHPSESFFRQRLVHLDLKGAPPKLSYLSELLVHVKDLGGTGFLIEYDDTFPFEGNLSLLSAENAYGRGELENFLRLCAVHNMSVIPLVQTFGHLEYALKLKEFAHLREDVFHPGDLCPRQNGTKEFIEGLLKQTIEFHMRVPMIHLTHIHIGGEGFLQTPECPLCRTAYRPQLYLEHLQTVSTIMENNWPQLKIILWSDVLLDLGYDALNLYNINWGMVEPMLGLHLSRTTLNFVENHDELFPALWAASSFRYPTKSYQLVPYMSESLTAVLMWLDAVSSLDNFFFERFRAIVLTGSQKSSHFAVLDSLLPATIPTLFLSLLTANGSVSPYYDDGVKLREALNCSSNTRLQFFEYVETNNVLWNCSYFGQKAYETMLAAEKHMQIGRDYAENLQHKMSIYQADNNLSPSLKTAMQTCHDNIADLKSIASTLQDVLKEIYDEQMNLQQQLLMTNRGCGKTKTNAKAFDRKFSANIFLINIEKTLWQNLRKNLEREQ